MEATCVEREARGMRRDSLFFDEDGKLIPLAGWRYGHGEGGGQATGIPGNTVYVVDHPFRPSLASIVDMISEHEATGDVVAYTEERWEIDPRVDEQIAVYGPDVADDWKLERLLDRLSESEERKVAA